MKTEVTTFHPIPCPFKWSLRLLLGAGGLPLSLEHALHLLPLSFAADVSSETLLGELQATLVFRHLQQLQTALFVRSETGDLSDHFPDKFDVFVLDALSSGWFRRAFVLRHTESFVSDTTDRHSVLRRH